MQIHVQSSLSIGVILSMRIEIAKRKYDDQYTLWGWMPDPTAEIESEKNIPYISMRWVALGIFGSFNQALQHYRDNK